MTHSANVDLADSLDASVFEGPLGRDIQASLSSALEAGVHFADGRDPLALFRAAIRSAIRDIESHRGQLLQRFLKYGPPDPDDPERTRFPSISDQESAAAINFICRYVVSAFQGSLAEMLAAGPCSALLCELQQQGRISQRTRLFAGDSVRAAQTARSHVAKAADLHVLQLSDSRATVAGVIEVKSCRRPPERIAEQLSQHISRTRRGLVVGGREYPASAVDIGGCDRTPVKVAVVPSTWKLPRTIEWEGDDLRVNNPDSPLAADVIERLDQDTWRITLRWSHEVLAADAFEMTFWYMSKVGEVLYAGGSPWPEMTPAEAGRNAVKWSLYRATLLDGFTKPQRQRALAIYNIYGFGYALGNRFRSTTGERDALFPADLREIAATGRAVRINSRGEREVYRIV